MTPLFSPTDFLNPQLSISTQAFIRIAGGALMTGSLALALPQWRRFFMSERWGGYAQSARVDDAIQNPIVSPIVGVLWFVSTILITLGWWSVWAALVNLILCRYFFVRMRWKGVLRGMGAPGFMSYWLAAAIFLLEFTLQYAPNLRSLALLVLQVDFALIMLSAGVYKFTAGYAHNQGMEGGMVNPQWGYWWWLYKKVSPSHPVFKSLNQMAWSLEVIAGVLMLIPPTRFVGSLLMLGSFIFIATHIRLGLLCEMVIVACCLFFHPGSLGDQLITPLVPATLFSVNPVLSMSQFLNPLFGVLLWAYLILLALAHAGLFYNFYAKRALPGWLQPALDAYTNFFGIIIWRVFSADHTNFFVEIYYRRPGGERTLVSRRGLGGSLRFNHVAESIALTSLFTTLKYYPTNDALFRERLLRYARTVPRQADSTLEFEYIRIARQYLQFEFVPVAVYTVDVDAETVNEQALVADFDVRAALPISPVHEGARPGSYLPLKG